MVISNAFPKRIIGRPDLTPLNFFHRGCLRKTVYTRNARDLNSLEAIIRDECGRVPNGILARAVENVQPRLEKCAVNAVAYIEF